MIKRPDRFILKQVKRFVQSSKGEKKVPKLQTGWEGPYCVVRKLSDIVYCIRKSNKYKNKIIHMDRLASYLERYVE